MRALKQTEPIFAQEFASKTSRDVGMDHIARRVPPAGTDYEEAVNKLYSYRH
jgi:hypothetical protein